MDREKIFEAIENEIAKQEIFLPKPTVKKSESPEVQAIAHYLWLTDVLAVLIKEIGGLGEALMGEKDLKEELVQVTALCIRWLESLK